MQDHKAAEVDDIFAAIMVLVAGIHKNVLVRREDEGSLVGCCEKQLLSNINGFMDILRNFKVYVDNFEVPTSTGRRCGRIWQCRISRQRSLRRRTRPLQGLTEWVINIVKYHDTIVSVEPKRQLWRTPTSVWRRKCFLKRQRTLQTLRPS